MTTVSATVRDRVRKAAAKVIIKYLYLSLMYKLKGFILSLTTVSLLGFNNTGLGGSTVRDPARTGPLGPCRAEL